MYILLIILIIKQFKLTYYFKLIYYIFKLSSYLKFKSSLLSFIIIILLLVNTISYLFYKEKSIILYFKKC